MGSRKGSGRAGTDDTEQGITVHSRAARSDHVEETAFTPGDEIAGRYFIRRFIAFGGMGEVYEADDRVLRETVALKTIRPDVADDAAILERFKREILLARRVTHPNVCRIFDLGVHARTGRSTQTFLTMELLSGQTLADRLRMGKTFSIAEAAAIVPQMTAALDAAHREGIVHRDFKSGNVMLCPKGRAVVTDFGLARGVEGDPFASNATGGVGILGSPAYMAPEQVEGTEVGPAADIYALGVVLFEMVTGYVPFAGESVMACAAKRLKGPAPSPRIYVPDLDRLWERVILRCLERDPADRYATAGDVARALAGENVALGRRESAQREEASPSGARSAAEPGRPEDERRLAVAAARRRGRWRVLVAAALGLVVAGTGGWVLLRRSSAQVRPPPAAAVASRRAVAVMGFKNVAGRDELGWLSTAFAEMLTTELGAGNELRTIPGETLARMKRDLALHDAESYASDTLARIHENVDADYVVVGSFVPLGNQIRLDVRLQDTASGETLVQIAESGGEDELASLVGRAGAQLRERLSVGPLSPSEQAIVNAALPQNPEAARLYSEGLAKAHLYLMGAARELLERALIVTPGFAQGHIALAEALAYLGYEARAREEATRAYELAGKLPDEERLGVEAQYHFLTGNPGRAAETYGTLFARFPDSLEWGMRKASAQFSAGNEAGGNATIAALRKLPNAEDDPRIYVVLQQAAMMRQDYKALRTISAKLAHSGEARGALSLVGEARQAEALALWFEGDVDGAIASAEQARELAFTIGDRDGVAAALTTKGWVLTEKGGYAAARTAAEQALEVAAEVGSRRRIWAAEHVLARAAFFTGDLALGRRRFEASRRAAALVSSQYGEALAKLGLAVVCGLAGDLDEARPLYAELTLGFRLFAPKHNMAYLLHYYGDLQLGLGDMVGARKSYDEALALRRAIGEELQGQRDQIALAQLALALGNAADAERIVRSILPILDGRKLHDDAATARAILARALRAQGLRSEAQAALAEAVKEAEGSEGFMVALEIALARGEVIGAEAARLDEALQILDDAVAQATAKGYLGYAYELRLARARVLVQAGRRAAAQVGLGKLAAEASQRGYLRIARLATALEQ